MKYVLAVTYALMILATNWALGRWGFVPLLGVSSMMVPAGVYFAGLTFGVRDAMQEVAGLPFTLAAVVVGAGLSWFIEPSFALASGVAFLLSELLDLAVYTPLRERQWVVASVVSNIVGSLVDSMIFLGLAFHSIEGWGDLTIGKALMTAVTLPVIYLARRRRRDLLRQPV